jgi:phospho-N-acetylmuramoyl-pentapeptide-transferase
MSNLLVRCLVAALLSFGLVAALGRPAIRLLQQLKVGQRVRDDGPQTHLKKMGIPTMGGLFFAVPGLLLALLWAPGDPAVLAAVAFALIFAGVGFADDYLKVVRKRPLGLRARAKLAVQIPAALLIAWFVLRRQGAFVAVPFGLGGFDLGWLYLPLAVLGAIFVGNAVNITDGVDGLLAGAAVPSFAVLGLAAAAATQPGLASLAASMIGACAGFLLFNHHPARVIMGDTGSLAIGGAMTALALLTKTELLLAIIGLLYIIEALSVILQVISFRTTGKRIFRMSPLHHHFELLGWSEPRVVRAFWLVSLLAGVVGALGLSGMAR